MEADAGVVSEIVGVATVSDGSTIRIGPRRIRFDGVATPGPGSVCGDVNVYRGATDALRQITRSNEVRCRISDAPDSAGRDIAQCAVRDADLGEYMVANGWARELPRYSGGAYADEEAAARAARLGVWAPSCPANLWGDRDFSN
jgi:endonuclease YncB( thermonuclease family)